MGGYLNFNVWGNAVPRLAAIMQCLILFGAAGAAAAFFLFLRGRSLVLQKARRLMLPFRPYQSLLPHEGYKILFTNRALLLLFFAALLLGWKNLGKSYTCPAKKQYYADVVLSLEGRLPSCPFLCLPCPLCWQCWGLILQSGYRFAEYMDGPAFYDAGLRKLVMPDYENFLETAAFFAYND